MNNVIKNHPCFSEEAHKKFGRIHLPVAPSCNIQCRYCIRKFNCIHESRPGITSNILTPYEALERVSTILERHDNLSVIGIAGPGDPLANETTFQTLRLINREFPDLILCISTNGLSLPERLKDLVDCRVKSLTITINALNTETAEKIYSWAQYRDKFYTGKKAAELILHKQWEGLKSAIKAGLIIKINTILIPGVNDDEIPLIAMIAGKEGAHMMNILPLIPQAEFSHLQRPCRETIHKLREECGKHILQMSHCRQCRADACGIIGEDKDMELEMIYSKIGEEYEESII